MLDKILIMVMLVLVSATVQARERQIYITEMMAANDDTSCINTDSAYDPDWIELYNVTDEPIDLKGWFLSDDDTRPFRWWFPESAIVLPKDYLLIFMTGIKEIVSGNRPNFRLSHCGKETIILNRPNKEEEDRLYFGRQTPGTSFGRTLDLKEARRFENPTPGLSNDSEPPESNCKIPRPPPTRLECSY